MPINSLGNVGTTGGCMAGSEPLWDAACVGPPARDRIDITDDEGVAIGWVDPRTGTRHLVALDRSNDFDSIVDFWMSAAGLDASQSRPDPLAAAASNTHTWMRVSEVRYPDREMVRSLVIPLLPLR